MLGEFLNAVSAVVVLLMLMAVGYFMGTKGWMKAEEKKFLSKYIINIAVPCNCINGLLNNLDQSMLAQAGLMLVSAIIGVVITILLGMGLATLLRLPKNRWGVFAAMVGVSNTLFVGLPLSTQLFGDVCVPYVMIYYLANTIFTQSVILMLVERSGTASHSRGIKGFLKDVFTKPPILTVIASVLMLIVGFRPPEVFMSFAKYISGSVSPLALIYCGFIIYELGLSNLRPSQLRQMKGLPTMLAAGDLTADLCGHVPPVRHYRPGLSGLCSGERPAGGQSGDRNGGGLRGGRQVCRHRCHPVHPGLLYHHPCADGADGVSGWDGHF